MLKKFSFITLLVVGWYVLCTCLNIPDYVLPSPYDVFWVFVYQGPLLMHHSLVTLQLIISGFLLSIVLALTTTIALDRLPRLLSWIRPILLAFQSIPTIVLLPLLIVWMGYGFLPRLMIMVLSCYFPIVLCAINGLQQTPSTYMNLSQLLNGGYLQSLYHIRFPAALPYIFSGLQMAALGAPLNAIAADWVGASQGLGYIIMFAHGQLKTDLMFAATLLMLVIAYALYRFVDVCKQKIIFWRI